MFNDTNYKRFNVNFEMNCAKQTNPAGFYPALWTLKTFMSDMQMLTHYQCFSNFDCNL